MNLKTISSVEQLSWLLGVDYGKVLSFALYRLPQASAYKSFPILKRDGTERVIDTPGPTIKKLQRALLPWLEEIYDAPPCVHGHVKGRSIKTNAEQHVGRRYVANVDLRDFYPRIHFQRVSHILQSPRYGLHKSVAIAVAQLCCHNGRLPIGAPTSGILSNIVCGPLDSQMLRLAKRHHLRYTRYVDDLTFSSPSAGHLANGLGLDLRESLIVRGGDQLSEQFVQTIASCGFEINQNKVWASTKHVRQQVTGLVVNKKPNVPIKYFRQTRSMVHSIEKFGHKKANAVFNESRKQSDSRDIISHVHGRLAHLGHVVDYDARYTRLAAKFIELTGRRLPLPLQDRERATYVVKTSPSGFQGTALHIGNGYFLTASHTFDNKPDVEYGASVFCPKHFPAPLICKVVCRDTNTDAALLKAAPGSVDGRPVINLVLRSISIGDKAHGFGYANYLPGASLHIVSAKMSASRKLFGQQRSEVDKPWPHGMSGGPVFDENGLFLGIIYSGPKHGTDDNPVGTAFTPYKVFAEQLQEWLEKDSTPIPAKSTT